MNKTFTKGFVFYFTLVFLYLFSLIGLYSLQNASVTFQVTRDRWQKMLTEMIANKVFNDLKVELQLPSKCLIAMAPTHFLKKKPLAWWQASSCSGNLNGNQYYYFVEQLNNTVPNHYRISLLLVHKQLNLAFFLQGRVQK